MRFMMFVKGDAPDEAAAMPDAGTLEAMTDYNEQLVDAGVLIAAEGLRPSSRGWRTELGPDGARTVVDGPFAASEELVAGFWLLQVESREEMRDWSTRCPAPVEVREVFEIDDFAAYAPEQAERERRLAERMRRG
ncbi:YciI family protein [Saccharopolyspora sp. CA-218241]|uniref:YciI family protein n=2 Tax=Saccharopolyspora cebuensis TaxID=418759 RepID=A0ABV4CEV6_9PSEU